MPQQMDIVPLRGGLDLVTPAMMIPKGFAIAAVNYEPHVEGYRRMEGYERRDGRPRPSDAEYYVLGFDAGSVAIVEDATVTGATSGATGICVVDAIVTSGTWAGGDVAGSLILYNVSGTFQDDENLEVAATPSAVANGTAQRNAADNDNDNDTYIEAVKTKRRAAIGQPSGSGAIRGVATYAGVDYCWRDNAGGTAGQMFKSSTAGWVLQSFGRYILFDAGTTAFAEGETLTGGTSGATGTIERVILNGGAWDGTGTGYLVLSGVTGAFQNDEAITSASGAATANGADVEIALPPGGAYNAVEKNFYATTATTRMYVANGVGYAFEWDGSVLAPIFTQVAAAVEKPKYVEEYELHLALGYETGSLQVSSPGLPLVFDGNQGAFEAGIGQAITGLKSNKSSLIITARNKLAYMVGTSALDFTVKMISEDSGAIEGTTQIIGQPVFMDDRGIRDMTAAQVYGDWIIGTLTALVDPLLKTKKAAGAAPAGSLRVRTKDQYRLYYDDDSGFTIYFGRGKPEILPFLLGFTPACFASGEDASGNERLLAGSDDGWVYELDRGTSFDGAVIEHYLRTAFLHQNMPNIEKRYHQARLEGRAAVTNTTLSMSADFGYGSPNQPPSAETGFTFYGAGGFWDEAYWDEFQWDAQVQGQVFVPLDGIGENVSVVFAGSSATEDAHALSALTINYSRRRKLR